MSDQIYDPFRGLWVKATPEELVRQRLLHYLTNELGFPKGLIAIEKELSQLPHLQITKSVFPNRRIDILCYGKVKRVIVPLVLIECKTKIDEKSAFNQVLGYNAYIKALCVAVADREMIYMYRRHLLPSYAELINGM